jgi:hypothetical protein
VIGKSGPYSQPYPSQPEGFAAVIVDTMLGIDAVISKLQLMENSITGMMEAEKTKGNMERFRALQDMQTKIFEIHQDVTLNRARTDDVSAQWENYIRTTP